MGSPAPGRYTEAMNEADHPQPPDDSGVVSGTYRQEQVSALVPEHVGPGVFATGAIVMTTRTEFILDFLIRMARPHQVVARVVLPPAVVPQVVNALRQATERWTSHFGPIPSLPRPPAGDRPQVQDFYDDLKLPDAVLSGAYANGVMISFSASEFSFDFITHFYPRAAVSQRVYMAVPQVPRMLETLEQTLAALSPPASGPAPGSHPGSSSGKTHPRDVDDDRTPPGGQGQPPTSSSD